MKKTTNKTVATTTGKASKKASKVKTLTEVKKTSTVGKVKTTSFQQLTQKLESAINAGWKASKAGKDAKKAGLGIYSSEGTILLQQYGIAVAYSVLRYAIDPQAKNGMGTSAGEVMTKQEAVYAGLAENGLPVFMVADRPQEEPSQKMEGKKAGQTAKKDGKPSQKKDPNPDYSRVLESIRRDLARSSTLIQNMDLAFGLSGLKFDQQSGEVVFEEHMEVEDADEAIQKFTKETFGEGIDLAYEAITLLLEEVDKASSRGVKKFSLEGTYTIRKVKRQVYTIDEKNIEWIDEEVTPRIMIFRGVRSAIKQTGAGRYDPRSSYLYLEEFVTDDRDDGDGQGPEEVIYRRLPKYSDLGGTPTASIAGKFDGWEFGPEGWFSSMDGISTVNENDVAEEIRLQELIEKIGPSPRQKEVLMKRLYSKKTTREIAKDLKVSENAVKGSISQLKEKCDRIGLNPDHEVKKPRSHHAVKKA